MKPGMADSKKERSSSVELLRIFAAVGVMILHINLRILPQMVQGTANTWIMYLGETVSIGAVNIFLLISGYYMCRSHSRSLWKPVEMLAQLVAIKLCFYFLAVVLGHQIFSLPGMIRAFVPNNYYVIFYIVLYLVSLYFNQVFPRLNSREFKTLVVLLFLVFSVWPTIIDAIGVLMGEDLINLSSITREGSAYGYNIVQFSLMYIVGAYLGYNRDKRYSKRQLILLMVFCAVLITMWARYAHSESGFSLGVEYSYCNPAVIAMAVAIFLMFVQWDWRCHRMVNRLARASFTVYLMHPWIIKMIPFERIMNASPFIMIPVMAGILAGIYVLCWIAYEVWAACTTPIFSKLEKRSFTLAIHPSNEGKDH